MALNLELNPLRSVGPFVFGEPAQPVIEEQGFTRATDPIYNGDPWDTYESPDGETTVHVEGGVIDSAGCYSELNFGGVNLIGLSFEALRELLGPEDEVGDDISGETPVEFESFGLQVWIKDGVVESIMCHGPTDDTDE